MNERAEVVKCTLTDEASASSPAESAGSAATGLTIQQAVARFWDFVEEYTPFGTRECMRILLNMPVSPRVDTDMTTELVSGTEIYLFQLRTVPKGPHEGKPVLDWETSAGDIADCQQAPRGYARPRQALGDDVRVPPEISMRAFCEVMFLQPCMAIRIADETTGRSLDNKGRVKPLRGGLPNDATFTCQNTVSADDHTLLVSLCFSKTEKEAGRCGVHLYWCVPALRHWCVENSRPLRPIALRRNNILIEPLSDLQGKCTALVKHAGKNASGVVGAVQLNHIDPDPQKEAFLKTVSRTCARHLPDPLL